MNTSIPFLRLFACIGLILISAQASWAQVTRYVSTTGTNTNPASATSWATSTTNLQGAIDASVAGNQVWVSSGLYKPTTSTGPDSRTISFSMKNGVAIYGGFVGNETSLNQRPAVTPVTGGLTVVQPSSTTLSGEIGDLNSTADNSFHVIFNETGLTNSAVLDGFVITGGNADLLDIRDGGGGGVFNNAGINLDGTLCSPTFRNCLFRGNSAQAGGAMLNYGQAGISSPVLINCAFVSNYAPRNGGAIANDGSDGGFSNPVLTNCLFVNNRADLLGGAIFNTAEFQGTSSPALTNCAFQSNTSGDSGGAMFNEGSGGTSSPTLTNCSFQSNTSPSGGALYNNGPSGTSNVQLANSAFWNNGDGNTFVNNNATLTATYSLFQPSVTDYVTSPTNLTNVTTSPFVAPTSVSLVTGSAAINAGNPTSQTVTNGPYSANALPATDLAGNARVVGGRVDIGAIEYSGPFNLTLVTAATPGSVCRGSSAAFSVTARGGSPGYSYTWTAPTGITLSATSTSAISGTVGNTLTGVQTLTIKVADASPTPNVSTSVVSFTVNIPPTPTLTVGPSGTLTCNQSSLTLTANGGVSYAFSGPGVVSQNTLSGTAVVNQAGTYSVVVTGANSCTARSTVVVSQSLAPATRLYVSASQTAINGGDGLSWATAFKDLQSALAYPCSQSLTEIWVAGGVYKPTSTTIRTVSFAMRNGLAIIGGFVGNETSLNERPPINSINGQPSAAIPSSSTLSGDIGVDGDGGDNSFHLINNTGVNNTAVLDGFVLRGGNASGSPIDDNDRGGAVLNNTSSPTFRNCLFQSNRANYAGGAMYNAGTSGTSSPQFTNCLFVANVASSYGGALYNDAYFGTSSPVMTNCAFLSNVGGSGGGAIYNEGNRGTSSPVLTNCLFQGNSANVAGALFNDGNGGTSNPVLTNCAFLSNSATGNGGAMYNSGGGGNCNPIITNCSFQGNRSAPGMVMFNDGTNGGTCRPQLTNSVFWDNGDGNTFFNSGTGASIIATYCLFQSSVSSYSSSPTNLTNATVSPFVSSTSVTLLPYSPAIDAGNPASITVASPGSPAAPYSATALPTTDLAGNARILRSRIDMGSIEHQGPFSLTLLTSARPTVLCETRSVSLSVTVSGGVTGPPDQPYSYTWTAPAGITLSATSTSVVSATVDNSLTGPQTLTVTVTDSAPTPSVSSSVVSFTVANPPNPTLSVIPASATLNCVQTSLTLTATGGVSYSFSGPGVVSQNAVSGTAIINQPGTYSVLVTAGSSCTARTSVVISQTLIQPARLYVSASQTANVADGLSWTTAFRDLQSALNYACSQSLTEIWVARGVYKPTSTANRTVSFSMRNNLAIIGGFAGNETSLSERPPINPISGPGGASQPSSSTLSGDLLNNDGPNFANYGDNSQHVISNPPGLNNTAVLDGFVITGGNASGGANTSSPENRGGGVYNNGSGIGQVCSPSFQNCSFIGNTTSIFGGVMFNNGASRGQSNPVLINCDLSGNSALQGGVMCNAGISGQANPVLINCSMIGNSARFGGVMYNDGVNGQVIPVLTNCSLLNNSAQVFGGAIYNTGSNGQVNSILTNSVIWNSTFYNVTGGVSATYSLFDNPNGVDITGPGNLTTTLSPFVSANSVVLRPLSPALNGGNPASVTVATPPYSATNLPATDLAGNPRIVLGRVDMGAVEYQGPFSLTLLTNVQPNPTCVGSIVNFPVTATGSPNPTYSYTWSAPAGISLSGTSTSAVSASVGTGLSGVQMLTVTVADASTPTPIVNSALVSLTIATTPALSITPSAPGLGCSVTALTLSALTNANQFRWSDNSTNPTLTVSASGTYGISVTASNGCTASTTLAVGSNGYPAPNALLLGSGNLSCITPTLTLTAVGGNRYQFSGPGILSQTDGRNCIIVGNYLICNTPIPTIGTAVVNKPGLYTVLVTNENGCTATAQIQVTGSECR